MNQEDPMFQTVAEHNRIPILSDNGFEAGQKAMVAERLMLLNASSMASEPLRRHGRWNLVREVLERQTNTAHAPVQGPVAAV